MRLNTNDLHVSGEDVMLDAVLFVLGVFALVLFYDALFQGNQGVAAVYRKVTGQELFPEEEELDVIQIEFAKPDFHQTLEGCFNVNVNGSEWWYEQLRLHMEKHGGEIVLAPGTSDRAFADQHEIDPSVQDMIRCVRWIGESLKEFFTFPSSSSDIHSLVFAQYWSRLI